MFIRVVVVGIDHWEDLTKPFFDSLQQHNPGLDIVVVDNDSELPYPNYDNSVFRTKRTGYGVALNGIATHGNWSWLLCCNNDCLCNGEVTDIIAGLSTDTIYGNDWKYDYDGMQNGLPAVVDSAYLLIPRRIWNKVGKFDPLMDAAFEEIDYQIRALNTGFRLAVVDLPIIHLNHHTRKELPDYEERWMKTRDYFHSKHVNRDIMSHAA